MTHVPCTLNIMNAIVICKFQEFVLHVDDLAFWISKSGIFGRKLQGATDNIYQLEVEESPAPTSASTSPKKCRSGFSVKPFYFVNFLFVFLPLATLWIRQEQGLYGCNSISIKFPEPATWDGAIVKVNGISESRTLLYSSFNGVYKKDRKHDGYPRYVEQNKENGEPFTLTIGAVIIYCRDLESWVFTHQDIYKSIGVDVAEVRTLPFSLIT